MGRHVLDDRHLSAGWGSKKGGGMKLNRRLLERSRQHLDARITDHDQSGNGKFNLIPRTVTIAEGETVTYDIFVRFGIHQPAVYEAGTTPDDIDIEGPFPFVNDPEARLAIGPAVSAATGTATWTTPGGTFDQPGRYLVLCNFAPHFAGFNMYGWVEVK